MKARSILLSLFALFVTLNVISQEIPEQQDKFVNKFVDAVASNTPKKIYKCLDKKYRAEQLENLEGDKQQLIDELFGGEQIGNSSEYVNIKIEEITKIEIAEAIPLKSGNKFNYIFRIRTAKNDVYCSIMLVRRGKKYGFVGSLG